MRNPKKTVSPTPSVFYRTTTSPEALEREATSKNQKDFSENTIIWGEDNQFPLKLAQTVHDSPAGSACINTIAKFIKGAKFSDAELMKVKINKTGQTLWDLHCALSDSLAMFEGFTVNLKFNEAGDITNAYSMAIENSRFVKPDDDLATNITHIKYNPYFGTGLYQKKYTKEYPIWDPLEVTKQAKAGGKSFPGQVYYHGKTKPLFRFYPRPSYWSAKGWMYIDSKIQEGHSENMDNGFFQSVIINMIGDPNKKSTNPAYMKQETVDGVVRYTPDRTVGEEFADMMKANFSGTKKQGSAMVFWSVNKDSVANIEAFPSSANSDIFETLQDLTTKNITIATQVPGILANISEGVNLGSGGSEIQKAVEIMQSNTSEDRSRLEQFYNEILIPKLALEGIKIKKGSKVEIVNYNPITVPVVVEDKFWEELDKEERRAFIRKNLTGIELKDPIEQTAVDEQGNPVPETLINENLRNLTGMQLIGIQRIVRKFNKQELTEDQAKQLLISGFGFTDADVKIWLVTPEEEEPAPMKAAV